MKKVDIAYIARHCTELAINKGELVMVPSDKMRQSKMNHYVQRQMTEIVVAIADLVGKTVLRYVGYTAKKFDGGKRAGVHIGFVDLQTGEPRYTLYNASVTYARATAKHKAGDALPKNQFRVGKLSKFVKFWDRCCDKRPDRLSHFHSYMGNLKKPYLTGEVTSGERLAKDSVSALNVSHAEIKAALERLEHTQAAPASHPTDTQATPKPDTQGISRSPGHTRLTAISSYGTNSLRLNVIRREGDTVLTSDTTLQ